MIMNFRCDERIPFTYPKVCPGERPLTTHGRRTSTSSCLSSRTPYPVAGGNFEGGAFTAWRCTSHHHSLGNLFSFSFYHRLQKCPASRKTFLLPEESQLKTFRGRSDRKEKNSSKKGWACGSQGARMSCFNGWLRLAEILPNVWSPVGRSALLRAACQLFSSSCNL